MLEEETYTMENHLEYMMKDLVIGFVKNVVLEIFLIELTVLNVIVNLNIVN